MFRFRNKHLLNYTDFNIDREIMIIENTFF